MKKILSLIIAVIFICSSLVVTANAENEYDCSDSLFETVKTAHETGLIDGDKTYLYNDAISRVEYCELVYNLILNNDSLKQWFNEQTKDKDAKSFNDTENEAVNALYNCGIVYGKTKTEFKPQDKLTNEEAATIIVRLIDSAVPMAKIGRMRDYKDAEDISDWAFESYMSVRDLGITEQYMELNPKDLQTAGQAIVILTAINYAIESDKSILTPKYRPGEKLSYYRKQWFYEIASNMFEENKDEEREISQEYILANSISFSGVEFFNIRVFSDKTGQFIYKFCNSEDLPNGEILCNESVFLNEEQTAEFISIIETNNFWEIPAEHPEERMGLDGYTLFAEGVSREKYNIISMWSPYSHYEIRKIYDGILNYAEVLGVQMR